MNKLRNDILSGSASMVSDIVISVGDQELASLFLSEDSKLIEKVLTSVNPKSCQKIFAIAPIQTIVNFLNDAPNNVIWRFLKHARPNQLHKLSQVVSEALLQRLIDSAPSRNLRHEVINGLPIEKRKKWQEYAHATEAEVTYAKHHATDANSSLIDERKRLLDELSAAISAKESTLRNFEDEMRMKQDHLNHEVLSAQNRLQSIEQVISQKEVTFREKETELAKRLMELDEANRKQVQQRIEVKVPEYVSAAVKVLEDRELLYRTKASHWSIHGTIVLVVAIVATTAISLYGSGLLGIAEHEITWPMLVFISFKGLVVLGVLGLWAKHAFTVSNAYMHEAIKRSDRAHAINFGKLYLEIYGNSVDRKELLDIFENWNITSESAFSKVPPSDFEPKILEKLTEVLKVADRAKPSAG